MEDYKIRSLRNRHWQARFLTQKTVFFRRGQNPKKSFFAKPALAGEVGARAPGPIITTPTNNNHPIQPHPPALITTPTNNNHPIQPQPPAIIITPSSPIPVGPLGPPWGPFPVPLGPLGAPWGPFPGARCNARVTPCRFPEVRAAWSPLIGRDSGFLTGYQ